MMQKPVGSSVGPWLFGLAWTALCVSAVGCQNGGTDAGGKRLVSGPTLDPPDVPIPTGFRPVETKSSDQASGSLRNVWHEYKGRADRAALRNFYRDQMPSYRWSLISDQNIKGEITLRYEKGDEECVVMIRPRSSLWNDTLIRVTVTRIERGGRVSPGRIQ